MDAKILLIAWSVGGILPKVWYNLPMMSTVGTKTASTHKSIANLLNGFFIFFPRSKVGTVVPCPKAEAPVAIAEDETDGLLDANKRSPEHSKMPVHRTQ